MQIKNNIKLLLFITVAGFLFSCGDSENTSTTETSKSKRVGVNEVIVHLEADPDRLNLVTATSSGASRVQAYIFEALTTRDRETLTPMPYLAKELGVMEEITFDVFGEQKEGLKYTYEIREEAKWNDGTPITGHDAAFYVKCIKNPKVDCESSRPYYEAIVDVEVDKANPKKLSIYFQDKYFLAESLSGLSVLQRSVYDPEGLMENISVKELSNKANLAKLMENKNINKFAKQFNSEEFSRDVIVGSGPYIFKSWVTGERIILEKNENWWAKDLVGQAKQFTNYPDKIVFEIIVDNTTAVTAQKDEGIDLMAHASKDYIKLKEDKTFLQNYKFELPVSPSYSYIGLNTKNPKLADKRVRQALSMAFDYETFNKVFLYGMSERTVSPIHPMKNYYNKDIVPYPYDLQKASALLEEAGWIDEDGDGTREKEIDGETIPFTLEFKYSGGSKVAENMGLMLKKIYSQLGIQLELSQKEWTVFLEDVKSHNFEMVTMAWVMGPDLSDMKQIWHTDSYNGGSNYVGFGNAYTDKLIEDIRYELDEEKRNKMYYEIQEIIHDEAPYIFLFTGKAKLAIHKRFDNAKGYAVRPGYDISQFQLNPQWGAAKATAE